MPLHSYLERIIRRENLSPEDSERSMAVILEGQASTALIAGFLVALSMKGETAEELLGFARAMRAKVARIGGVPGEAIVDTCGTGGDGQSTINISTLAAFVVAGAGARVAKHGNRSISSRCGSADLLEGLGVRVNLTPEQVGRAIREIGIGFLFAPVFHPAMKHAQPARLELKMRTVFNLLGPLTNPAGATAQLVGAPSQAAAELMAQALACLGLQRGFVVHGSDGLDEISTTGETFVLEIIRGAIVHRVLTPADFGVPRARLDDLRGGDLEANCDAARRVLAGERGPVRDIVLTNASAALVVAGKARSFPEGMSIAGEVVDSGAARTKLEELVRYSRQFE